MFSYIANIWVWPNVGRFCGSFIQSMLHCTVKFSEFGGKRTNMATLNKSKIKCSFYVFTSFLDFIPSCSLVNLWNKILFLETKCKLIIIKKKMKIPCGLWKYKTLMKCKNTFKCLFLLRKAWNSEENFYDCEKFWLILQK